MIRKLSLAVAVATALSPMGVFALGLGEIHSYSVLNQKFKAEIDLISVAREEVQDLRVKLASDEAFDRAGIERLFLLTSLKFSSEYNAAGKPVISVTSSDPIREPFLNFLLEVNWSKGRMVREYTVLLDPPVTLRRAPAKVSAPRMTAAPTTRAISAPMPSSKPMPASMGSMGGREYGPVQPNENLWTIAKMLRNSGESIEQVMMALQRHNPDAFINNNVNNLKVGKVLRLPEGVDVTALSHKAAREEFLAQTSAWRSGRSAVSTPSTGKKREAVKSPDRLKLISAKPDAGEEAMSREGDAEISRLEQEILLVRESNESAQQDNEALRTRVQELEKQIEDIQRLVTLKNDQLSQMQQAQQIAREKREEVRPTVAEPVPAEVEAPVAEQPMAEQPAEPAVVPVPEGTVVEQRDIEAVIEEATQAETPVPSEVVPAEKPEQPLVAEAPAKPEPVEEPVAKVPEKKSGYFENLTGNMTLMGIVGAVVVLLISMLWMIMRRRKEAEAEFAESILVSPDSEMTPAGKDEGDSLIAPSDETSFMSDFSPSDIDALQDETGEVDPLSEADVYIAYGRYQQAEELVKQAIEKFPEREELRHKLLEIYFSAKKSKEFSELAEDLHAAGLESSNPNVWSKVASMGKELNPTHALFAGAAGVAGATLAAGEDFEDLGLDLGEEFSEVTAPPAEAKPSEDIDSLDLSEEFSEVSPLSVEAMPGEDLDSLDLSDEFSEEVTAPPVEPKPSDDLDSMDLTGLDNLDEIDSESLSADLTLDSEFLDKMESGETSSEEVLDIDIGDLDLAPVEVETAESSELESSDIAIEMDDSALLDNMDLESIERELEGLSDSTVTEQESEPLELPEEEISEDISLDLDTTDEITTKLDLARAYIDMGDNEGAKSILEEVVNEGNDQQKQDAQGLLNGLG